MSGKYIRGDLIHIELLHRATAAAGGGRASTREFAVAVPSAVAIDCAGVQIVTLATWPMDNGATAGRQIARNLSTSVAR